MSEKIDWGKAPEWASVRIRSRATPTLMAWAESYTEGVRFLRDDYDGAECRHLAASFWELVAGRPTAPSWSGEGLPPVGVECEYMKRGGADWFHCSVIAEHDGGVVVAVHEDDLSYSYWNDTGHFRPIRTPEQIAADERERMANMLWQRYLQPILAPAQEAQVKEALGLMYDDFYRKP